MSYQKNWVPSPNFTPGSQTQAAYGRPRQILGGAGHWWNVPGTGANHDGIVSYMANAARQAAPHAVLSANRVTEMVRDGDTAWCTSNANPYTFAIEVQPEIMYRWGYGNPSAAQRALGNAIFETLCEYIADKGYHNLPWKPHNVWSPGTQCNPMDYNDIMRRAKEIWNEKYNKPKVVETHRDVYAPLKKFEFTRDAIIQNIPTGGNAGTRTYPRGEQIDIKQKLTMSDGSQWYRTQYSSDNEFATGFSAGDLKEVVAKPEWELNLKSIQPVKWMVLPAAGTNIVNLNDLSVIAPLAKGTYVDFVKSTTVQGKEYLISQYSADRAMPNGILRSDVGLPATPPVQEKPSWLDHWVDIENKTMYTRVAAPLVDLITGATIKTIPINTPIEVGSTTEWVDAKYAISEYSTGKKEPRGILLVHLDDKPIKEPETPVEPAPEQPDVVPVSKVVEFLKGLVEAILAFIASLTKKEK